MEFRNHTPFPALAFEGIDQHEQTFHVVVLRQSLTWGADGALAYADEQTPLCEVDEYFGAMGTSSIRQESDLCHYKPRCDVIVNASAHAPGAQAVRSLRVRLVVRRPAAAAPLPERPQGLNQFTGPSEAQLREWEAQTAQARQHPVAGAVLLDKTLVVTGARTLVRHAAPLRLLAGALRWGSLGALDPVRWRLTASAPFTTLPLRYEHAYGGECRINAGDRGAKRVRKARRLTPEQLAGHPDGALDAARRPLAHAAFESNAVGAGFAQAWYLKASGIKRMAAPRIEAPGAAFSTAAFWKAQGGSHKASWTAPQELAPAGFGVRAKVHPQRRVLGGTIDEAFVAGSAWLPKDFDFAIWNAAPVDQQIPFLQGDEIIELTNLCASDAPGAVPDGAGGTSLRLRLPGHACTLLIRMANGTMFFNAMKIDTVIVEPEQRSLVLVWRAVLQKEGGIRAVDARLHREAEKAFTQSIRESLKVCSAEELARLGLSPAASEARHG